MKKSWRKCIATSVFILAQSAAAAVASPPSDVPYARANNLSDMRTAIAWYGAACVMGASTMDTRHGPTSLASLAEETFVSLEQITDWASARDAEHSIAVDVLLRGGEPLRDPPEPFLTILRQAQSDCQSLEQSRLVLEAAINRGDLPEPSAPSAPGPLRTALDPFPFDFERRFRLTQVLGHIETALQAGDFVTDVEALMRAVSGRSTLSIADVRGLLATFSPNAVATDLLLPNPDAHANLSEKEVQDVLARFSADPEGDFARYYAGLLIANIETLGEGDQFFGAPDTEGEFVLLYNEDTTLECRRIAGSAALACESR